MGCAAGLVGQRAQTASGLAVVQEFMDYAGFLVFAPIIGVKTRTHIRSYNG